MYFFPPFKFFKFFFEYKIQILIFFIYFIGPRTTITRPSNKAISNKAIKQLAIKDTGWQEHKMAGTRWQEATNGRGRHNRKVNMHTLV